MGPGVAAEKARHTQLRERTEDEAMLPATVLPATDGSPEAERAARAAAKLCSLAGSELHLVHVQSHLYDYSGALSQEAAGSLEADACRLLEEQAALVEAEGGTVTQTHLVAHHPDDCILVLAEEVDAGLVVFGSRGLGRLKRMLVGSVTDGVAHRCSRPVLVVRGRQAQWPPTRIVLSDDGSEASRRAGDLAAAIGGLSGANATLVRAYPELSHTDTAKRLLDARRVDDELRRQQHLREERARNLEGLLGKRPHFRISAGEAAEIVVGAAEAESIMDAGYEEEEIMNTLISVGSWGSGRSSVSGAAVSRPGFSPLLRVRR